MDRLELIGKVVQNKIQLDSLYDEYYDIFNPAISGILSNYNELVEDYIELVTDVIGDKNGWLDWYIWENECGKGELIAGVNGDTRQIKSPEDIIWLLDKEKYEGSRSFEREV